MHCSTLLVSSLFIVALIGFGVAAPPSDQTDTIATNEKVATYSVETGAIEDPEKKKTTTTTTTTTTSTTMPPSSTTTTTTSPPETTTTTTTAVPTTSAPTTVPPPITTTTPAPVSTTTPKPKPYPSPEIGTWNSTCIKIQFAAQLNFTYITKDSKNATGLYNIPSNAVVDHAICDMNLTQSIQLNWGPVQAINSMVLQFDKKNSSVILSMLYFTIPLNTTEFPDAKENQTIKLVHHGSEFKTPEKLSYHCTRVQTLNLIDTIGDSIMNGTVALSNIQTEAFRTSASKDFATAMDCDGPGTSDVVPIAVGCALVALILIVLISYLCARRRSTLRGYMSF